MSNNDPNVDQPSTSGGGIAPPYSMASAVQYPQSSFAVPSQHQQIAYAGGTAESYAYSQPQQYYYPPQTGYVPQRSPIPPAPQDGQQIPPQIMVPRSDQPPQTIPQHSPAGARRPMSGQPVWPPDSNDSNSQHPPPHYSMPPQMMHQAGQPPQHTYSQGMAPPTNYWPPPHQRYAYPPGQDPLMQPPMHMSSHPSHHPYYLQVSGQPHAYPMPPKPMEGYQNGPNDPNQQPVTSTTEDEEAKRRLQQHPTNMHLSPATGYPHQQVAHPIHRPMHQPPPHMMAPHIPSQPGQIPPYVPTRFTHMLKPAQKEAVEKLVGVPSDTIPPYSIPQRREFFEQLVLLNDEQGEPLTAPPQVSKSTIDLHRLYIAVRKRGGFKQVTNEKSWKALCTEANSKMTESSAAGYQLRRHYQRHLLALECRETGENAEELKQFAEKLKKKRKEKETEGPSTPLQPSSTAGPPTPNSIRSAATPTPQHTQQPQPSPNHVAAPQHYHEITDQHSHNLIPPASDKYCHSEWLQSPSSSRNDGLQYAELPRLNYPSSSTPTMTKGRKRKNSDQVTAVRKRPPSKRQTKQTVPPNYYQQQNDYQYSTSSQYYDQTSSRNVVYAPTVSIPSANGLSTTSNAIPQGYAHPYGYIYPPQLQYSTYPSTSYPQCYPQQYQPGFLAPPGSKSENSNTTSPGQPSIKIPQVQPPNYPYPHIQPSYPSSQWNYGQRFGPPQSHPYGAPPNPTDPNAYYYQQQNASQQPMPSGQMPPPGSWPAYYGHPPAPQMRMPPTSASYYPPHTQQPATSMEYQPQPLNAPAVSQPLPTDRPSSSMSGAGQPQNASRPPSQAPASSNLPAVSTPDNRLSQQEEARPLSGQPPNVQHRPGHTPTPNSSMSTILGQPPPQAPHGALPQQPPYYAQPGGYRMPPPTGVQSAKSPYPQPPYQAMEPPNFIPPPHHAMYPPAPNQHQPGMWPPPHHQPNMTQPPLQRYPMPGKPQQHQMSAPDFRRPQAPIGQPQSAYFPGPPAQQMPSPGSIQRARHNQPPIQPSTSNAPGQPRHSTHQSQSHFSTGTLESTAPKLALSRKRPRIFARDFAWAPQRRLMMSLRSGQVFEMTWALNALTAMLYDDTQQPLRLDHTDPQLLSLLVEHLRATLAILYPKIDFNISETEDTLDALYENDNSNLADLKTLPATTSDSSSAKTRTDCQVKLDNVLKPERLRRMCVGINNNKSRNSTSALQKQIEFGRGSCFANRMYRNLQARLRARRALPKPTCSLTDRLSKQVKIENEESCNSDQENEKKEEIGFFYRRNYSYEVWDRFSQPDCSLLPRPAPLNERDPIIQELVDRAVCLSNLIRGLEFVPINCRMMHTHRGLLNICAKLLMLCVTEDRRKVDNIDRKGVLNDGDIMEVDGETANKETNIDDDSNVNDSGKFRVKQCNPERDSNDKLLLETANQLRDDAFTVLSQLASHLDLYNMDDETSYPLFDALIHWAITTNIQAQDPIHPGVISPRAYVFEIISKLSLLDKNIDLLLSTGSWPRLEEFVRMVCSCITMSEELPLREFAIVILQAISVASEPVCFIAATQTQVIHNLISFLEIADQAMTAIASNDGLTALRDNTERIGTSIGMLRRAIQILFNIAQHEACRPYFVRHQDKLLSFTVSSIMDSRVAITAASILYDIQNLPEDAPKHPDFVDEDFSQLSGQFLSCNWRLNDTDEEPDTQIQSTQMLEFQVPKNGQRIDYNVTTLQALPELSINGVDPVAINGNSRTGRKRLLHHPDGSEMSALEQELLRDSDAESIEDDDEGCKLKRSTIINNDHSHHQSDHLTKKTVSESVREKLHNHILKHEHTDADTSEPEVKRQKILGNGVISPKCNGDLNNKARPTTQNQQQAKAENGTPTPKNSSGSMTAVA